jgi:hypothetical protein
VYYNVNYASSADSIYIAYNADKLPEILYSPDSVVMMKWNYQDPQGEDEPQDINKLSLEHISIYPNPTNGVIAINVSNLKDYEVILYNLSGQILGRYFNAISIDLTYRSTGQYLVKIVDNHTGKSVLKKVIKH